MNPLRAYWGSSRSESGWFSVGPASSFPDVGLDDGDDGNLTRPRPCEEGAQPGCKAFYAPRGEGGTSGTAVAIGDDAMETSQEGEGLKDQVLVFRYKGKFHAVDHQCPHASFPLSKGVPFDIEDFGVVLSAGLTCPKHGWSFDLFTGLADRARYKLGVWEVQLREIKGDVPPSTDGADTVTKDGDKEVWVRRKQRMG